MKLFYQIFIIMFVVVSLFIIREDLITIYGGLVTYFKDGNNLTTNLAKSTSIKIKESTEGITKLPDKIETPGALVVTDKIFNRENSSSSALSSQEVIKLTNEIRVLEQGLNSLKVNEKLNKSALMKVDDMFAKGYFDHISPSGVGVSDLGNKTSYEHILMGENLAMGSIRTNEELIKAWMNSEGHRANIINKNYTEIGVAVKYGKYDGQNVWMAVQHFGLPKSACPIVDEVLKNSINFLNEKISSMGEDLTERKENIDNGGLYEGMTTTEQIIKYNSVVNDFNETVKEVKEKIDKYNEQVRSFNECLANIK
jgi:uncharacterized protein YkwD